MSTAKDRAVKGRGRIVGVLDRRKRKREGSGRSIGFRLGEEILGEPFVRAGGIEGE